MGRGVSRSGLNPDAPEFMPKPYPQRTSFCLSLPTSPQCCYISPPRTYFWYHTPYLQGCSSQEFYGNTYLRSSHQSLLLQPQQDLLPVVEPTITSMAKPPEETLEGRRVAKREQKTSAQKVNPRKYGTRCCVGRGGAWVRQAWWANCGRGKNLGRENEEHSNEYARKVVTVKKHARNGGRPRAQDKKRKSPLLLPVQCGEAKTTIMIRNIPSKYTRKMLVEFLDDHCMVENQKVKTEKSEEQIVSAFDFVYLPMDFSTGCNKGYAFVNFTDPRAVWKFNVSAGSQKWELFHSNKIREIAFARLQGEELVRHFESMGFPCEFDEVLPVCFSPPRDGSRESVKQRTVGRCTGTVGMRGQGAAGTIQI